MKSLKVMKSLSEDEKKSIFPIQQLLDTVLLKQKQEEKSVKFTLCDEKKQVIARFIVDDYYKKTLGDLMILITKALKERAPQMYSITINLQMFPAYWNANKPLLALRREQLDDLLWVLFGTKGHHILITQSVAITPQQNLLWGNIPTSSHYNAYEYALRQSCILEEASGDTPNKQYIEKLMRGLTHLDLTRCCLLKRSFMSQAGIIAVAEILVSNQSLVSLILQTNQLKLPGAKALADAIKENKTLTSLVIVGCSFEQEGLTKLNDALKVNTTLIEFKCVSEAQFSESFKTSIESNLLRNKHQFDYLDFVRLFLIETNILEGAGEAGLYAIILSYLTFDPGSVQSYNAVRQKKEEEKSRNQLLLQWLPTARLFTPEDVGPLLNPKSFQTIMGKKNNSAYDAKIMQSVYHFPDELKKEVPALVCFLNKLFAEKNLQNFYKTYMDPDCNLVVRGISPENLQNFLSAALAFSNVSSCSIS